MAGQRITGSFTCGDVRDVIAWIEIIKVKRARICGWKQAIITQLAVVVVSEHKEMAGFRQNHGMKKSGDNFDDIDIMIDIQHQCRKSSVE